MNYKQIGQYLICILVIFTVCFIFNGFKVPSNMMFNSVVATVALLRTFKGE